MNEPEPTEGVEVPQRRLLAGLRDAMLHVTKSPDGIHQTATGIIAPEHSISDVQRLGSRYAHLVEPIPAAFEPEPEPIAEPELVKGPCSVCGGPFLDFSPLDGSTLCRRHAKKLAKMILRRSKLKGAAIPKARR